jgi:hypothetical protein
MLDIVWLKTFTYVLTIKQQRLIQETISFPPVRYRYETWYLTLQEEHRLRVFKNRALGRILGPTQNEHEVGGGCKLTSFMTTFTCQIFFRPH